MGRTSGTYEATAVTTRQWIGISLALVAMVVTAAYLGGTIAALAGDDSFGRNEAVLRLAAWSYALGPDGAPIAYAYPPILPLALGFVTIWLSAGTLPVGSLQPILRAKGQWFALRGSHRDAVRNLTRQLHERGRAHLFSRRNVYVRLGLGLAGAGLVLLTALFAPTSITASGLTFAEVHMGWPPMVCLVGSVIALVGLLLAFPYGPMDRVVVDVAGNVRGADDPPMPSATQSRPLVTAHFCPQCGSPAPEGGRFCTSCGTDLAPVGSPAPV